MMDSIVIEEEICSKQLLCLFFDKGKSSIVRHCLNRFEFGALPNWTLDYVHKPFESLFRPWINHILNKLERVEPQEVVVVYVFFQT